MEPILNIIYIGNNPEYFQEINENISVPPFGDIAKIARGLDPENTKRIIL